MPLVTALPACAIVPSCTRHMPGAGRRHMPLEERAASCVALVVEARTKVPPPSKASFHVDGDGGVVDVSGRRRAGCPPRT